MGVLNLRTVVIISPTCFMISATVLNIPDDTQDIPHGTEHPQWYSRWTHIMQGNDILNDIPGKLGGEMCKIENNAETWQQWPNRKGYKRLWKNIHKIAMITKRRQFEVTWSIYHLADMLLLFHFVDVKVISVVFTSTKRSEVCVHLFWRKRSMIYLLLMEPPHYYGTYTLCFNLVT